MKRSEKFRQANREAKYTCWGTLAVIVFWIAAGFGLAGSDIVIWETPIWVIGGCIGTWIFSILVSVWIAECVIKDVDAPEKGEGGAK